MAAWNSWLCRGIRRYRISSGWTSLGMCPVAWPTYTAAVYFTAISRPKMCWSKRTSVTTRWLRLWAILGWPQRYRIQARAIDSALSAVLTGCHPSASKANGTITDPTFSHLASSYASWSAECRQIRTFCHAQITLASIIWPWRRSARPLIRRPPFCNSPSIAVQWVWWSLVTVKACNIDPVQIKSDDYYNCCYTQNENITLCTHATFHADVC